MIRRARFVTVLVNLRTSVVGGDTNIASQGAAKSVPMVDRVDGMTTEDVGDGMIVFAMMMVLLQCVNCVIREVG